MAGLIVVFDASVLIAYLSDDDALNGQATELLRRSADFDRTIPALTRAEVLVGFVRTGDESRGELDLAALGIRTIAALAGDADWSIEERSDAWAALVARTRATTGLKMPDAVVLTTAQQIGGFVATLDGRLRTAASATGCEFVL